MRMKSYSSELQGPTAFIREAISLYRLHSGDISNRVRGSIEDARRVEACVKDNYGLNLQNLDMLEIGPGQFLGQLTYFAVQNRVVGIDRDVIALRANLFDYLQMVRFNGLGRTTKTLARKLMGVDREYASQLREQLGIAKLPRLQTLTMDVRRMTFRPSEFDFVYSRSVLHSLRNPELALDEIARVLKPGGIAYISLHPYTSETGCLDPRIYTKKRTEVLGWPHLRPNLRERLHAPNLYLSKFRIEDWRRLFNIKMPGTHCILTPSVEADRLARDARKLQSQGELLDYSIDDLVTGEFVAVWQKSFDT